MQNQDFIIEDGTLIEYIGPGGDVVIPNHVVAIEREAFADCDTLVSVTLPKGLRYIGQEAFCGCENLKEVKVSETEMPEVQTELMRSEDAWIVDAAFMFCGNLTTVEIPIGITGIDTAVFMNCPKLSSVTIPETVTSISKIAFVNMKPMPQDGPDDESDTETDAESEDRGKEGGIHISIMMGIVDESVKPTIHGLAGSYAERFATENGLPFIKE